MHFLFFLTHPLSTHHWRQLVDRYDVRGRQVHDARLVAVMLTYDITHLLTLNAADFYRFEEITVVVPTTTELSA